MKEQLISFAVAKLAKELGYNEKCYEMFYSKDGKNYKIHEQSAEHYRYTNCSKFFRGADVTDYERSKVKIRDILKRPSDYPAKKFLYSRTSQSLLQKWLWEEYGILVTIYTYRPEFPGNVYLIPRLEFQHGKHRASKLHKEWEDNSINRKGIISLSEGAYERALEIGLLEALKLLKGE